MIISMLTGCGESVENPVEELVQWNIINVEGPTVGVLNQAVTFNVSCPTSSGCDYVSTFLSDDSNGKTILIKAYGGTTKNTMCTMAAMPIIVKYEFTPHEKGQYVLKFINKDESVIEYDLIVN